MLESVDVWCPFGDTSNTNLAAFRACEYLKKAHARRALEAIFCSDHGKPYAS